MATLPKINKTRFDLEIISLYKGGVLEECFRKEGIPVWTPKASNRVMALIESAIHIFALSRKQKHAIYHFWLPEAYLVGGISAVIAGARKLIMSRRSLNHYQKKHPVLARLEKILHKKMRLILANSDAIGNQLVEEGIKKEKIFIIKNGIDLSLFTPTIFREEVRRSLQICEDTIMIICVANLIPYKGHADLLKATAIMQNDANINWKLICVGRDEGIQVDLEKLAMELGIYQKIIFLGERNDIPNLLHASDISILASHQEGFSNTIIESMALGVSTIATSVGGNVEAIKHGYTGLLTPAKNPSQLAMCIVELCKNSNLRMKIGKAALADALIHRSIDASILRYEEIYDRINFDGRI